MSTTCVHDDIVRDIAVGSLARHLAERMAEPEDLIRRVLRCLIHEYRRAYRVAGAPYHDTAAGLVRWIIENHS